MLLQLNWSPWAVVPASVDPNLKVAAIVTFKITQPFKGAGLMVLYLGERMHCHLVGEDALQVPMDLEGVYTSPAFHDECEIPFVEEWHPLYLVSFR